MESYLPKHAYRDKTLVMDAIVIHYFSVINVNPADPHNIKECWMLMNDLNLPKSKRFQYLLDDASPEERLYASAHCMIGRDGTNMLTVPEDKQAYHAGKSSYKGRDNWNQFSYGIELIGSKSSGFTNEQYDACGKHCARLMREYNIGLDWIVGHEDVAPGRKVDPGIKTGNFDMDRLKRIAKQYRLRSEV